MLSYAFYGCENYDQLISLLKSDSFENQNLILAALYPNAELFLLKLLNTDWIIFCLALIKGLKSQK